MTGPAAALWIIFMRVGQGVGGAFLFANSNAIITDAFPPNERGLALGINGVAAIGGAFIGLILGGVLAPIEWRLVFLVSVPVGLFGTVWAALKLRDNGTRTKASIDWYGNFTFAIGLIALLTGIVYGLQPYGGHAMGWTSPFVLSCIIGGLVILAVFVLIELKVKQPMFQLHLFNSRGFAMGNIAALMLALARGGLQFMLIIWLQGIWLPDTATHLPARRCGRASIWCRSRWASSSPVHSRVRLARHGARNFATLGLVLTGVSLIGLQAIPINFSYPVFAGLLLLVGLSMGLFAAPNTSAVMNSLPADQRGAGGAMLNTFQNSASVLSIGFFFTVITLGLATSLPHSLFAGLTAQGVPTAQATAISHIPAIGSLFSAFLGINPIQTLLGSHLLAQPGVHASVLLGRSFFPSLIASPFAKGLHMAFIAAAVMCFIGAVFSWIRGGGIQRHGHSMSAEAEEGLASVGDIAMAEAGVGSAGTSVEPTLSEASSGD